MHLGVWAQIERIKKQRMLDVIAHKFNKSRRNTP